MNKLIFIIYKNRWLRKLFFMRLIARDGGYFFSPLIRSVYRKFHKIEIGYGSYGGCFDLANIPPGVKFGNYCSVAKGVKIFRANHPIDDFTTHPFLYNPVLGFVTTDQLERPELIIGHDVWIGENAIILPSVKQIGNGAIIGAGTILTKDVAPYSVVVGNPGKHIKFRFDPERISKLESTLWWDLSFRELTIEVDHLRELIK